VARLALDRIVFPGNLPGALQAQIAIKGQRSDCPLSRRGRSVSSGKASDMCNEAKALSWRPFVESDHPRSGMVGQKRYMYGHPVAGL